MCPIISTVLKRKKNKYKDISPKKISIKIFVHEYHKFFYFHECTIFFLYNFWYKISKIEVQNIKI